MDYIELNNGIKIPMLGLGTYLLTPDEAENSVEVALKNGYKLIDTANAYVNEKAVGRGIKKSGIDRSEIFLETKLWPSFYEDDDAIEKTLKRLDTDYIDLMILHQPAGNYIEGYKKLEKAYKEGKLKSIGISNFNEEEIQEILDKCEVKPALIQVESHPYFPRIELNKYLKKHNIALQSWYPLGGRGNNSIMSEKIIESLAQKYNKSNAQIILRWHIQMGYIVIPGARSENHIKENINIFDFKLTNEEMAEISKLNKNEPFYVRTDEALKRFASWVPDVENQK